PVSSRCSSAAAPVGSGALHATVQLRVAVVTLPAASVARTANWCAPARRLTATGLAHAAIAPPSKLHAGLPSLTVNANTTRGPLVAAAPGPWVNTTSGETVSTLHA